MARQFGTCRQSLALSSVARTTLFNSNRLRCARNTGLYTHDSLTAPRSLHTEFWNFRVTLNPFSGIPWDMRVFFSRETKRIFRIHIFLFNFFFKLNLTVSRFLLFLSFAMFASISFFPAFRFSRTQNREQSAAINAVIETFYTNYKKRGGLSARGPP